MKILSLKNYLIVNLLICSIYTSGANSKVDSLISILPSIKDDSTYLHTLTQISGSLLYTDSRKSLNYSEILLKESIERKSKRFETTANNLIGSYYFVNANYVEAYDYFLKALKCAREDNDEQAAAGFYHNISNILIRWHKTEKAIEYLNKAIEINLRLDNQIWLLNNYNSLSVLYLQNIRDYEKTIFYAKQAYQIGINEEKKQLCIAPLINITEAYKNLNQIDDAKEWIQIAFSIENDVGSTSFNEKLLLSYGGIQLREEKYSEALITFQKALETIENKGITESKSDIYRNLSKAHYHLGNFKEGYENLQLAYEFKDSIFSDNENIKIIELEAKNEIDQQIKINEIKELELQKSKKQTRVLVMLSGILVILTIVVIIQLYFRRKYSNILKNQHSQISYQKDELEKRNKNLQLLNDEKTGILNVVSHDFRAPLARIKVAAELLSDKITDNHHQNILKQIDSAITESNDLIDEMLMVHKNKRKKQTPPNFTYEMLLNVINHYLPKAIEKDIIIDLNSHSFNIWLDQVLIKRICDNILSNAIKYCNNGSTIKINTYQESDYFLLNIADNGPGISQNLLDTIESTDFTQPLQTLDNENSIGFGLKIIHKLAHDMGAQLNLNSNKFGTEFRIKFNLK